MAVDFILSDNGWIEVFNPDSVWNLGFLGTSLLGALFFTYLGFRLLKIKGSHRARMHAYIITLPLVIIVLMILFLNILIPMLGLQQTPPLAQGFIALWFITIAVLLNKYPIFTLSPRIAADVIVNAMSDMCLLVDPQGRIIHANPATTALLQFSPQQIIGIRVHDLLEKCSESLVLDKK